MRKMHLSRRNWCCKLYSLFTLNQKSFYPVLANQKRQLASSRHDRTFRIAVIGSGPSGFYASYKILSKIENSTVDMYERLPVPYGLVRHGVAPDHPEVKNCQEKFNDIANCSRFVFVGNISVGEGDGVGKLSLQSLIPHYNAILFAYGASQDRNLGIPGENYLKGIYSAREFVGWYNGQPELSELAPDVTRGEEAIIIGQGNVALDVARILLLDPAVLSSTDITENALEVLRNSKIKRVKIIGRRGPIQAAFTIKELREITNLSSVTFNPNSSSMMPDDRTISRLPRATRRIMELFRKVDTSFTGTLKPIRKLVSLEFCMAPKIFNADPNSPSHLGSIKFEKTNLIPDPNNSDAKCILTGEMNEFKSSMAFVAIGYKAMALSDFYKIGIPFNEHLGIIDNDGFGRVKHEDSREPIPGMYCAGWVKRGPTGVIANTMQDAFLSAESIAHDWYNHVPFLTQNISKIPMLGWTAVRDVAIKQGSRPVSWNDWQKIDLAERVNGRKKGKPREKFNRVEDMIAILD